jgi:hypothetical protein
MHMNGKSSHTWPPDHTSILVQMAGDVGEIKGEVRQINQRVAKLEDRKPPSRPLSEYIPPALGLIILAAATAGKVTWADALPSILGLVGR